MNFNIKLVVVGKVKEDFYRKQSKSKELDVLWQSFGVKQQKNEKDILVGQENYVLLMKENKT